MSSYDAVVIGAGPAGYVCAIRLAQLGQKTAIIEGKDLGGVCLNVGCIPSKAMISASKLMHKLDGGTAAMGITVEGVKLDVDKLVQWKSKIVGQLTGGVKTLLQKNGVQIIQGMAKVTGPNTIQVEGQSGAIEAKNIVIGTGSHPIEVPGFDFDGKNVWSSTEALAPKALPKRLVVIGGGYIGLELGFVYKNLGCHVEVVEFMDRVLPGMDPELSKEMTRSLKKRKLPVHLEHKAVRYSKSGGSLVVEIESRKDGKVSKIECDAVLSCVGRTPNGKGLGLEEIGVKVDDRGFVPSDAQGRTNVPSIWSIGDVAGQPMLAHKGSAEGLICAAAISGDESAAFDPAAIPAVIFTDPEIASVGLDEQQAKEQGFEPLVGKFPFRASGRALSLGETDGWVKVVADKATDKVLGVHMIGPEVTELIAEATLAIEMGATVEDLTLTIHAHPTLPEAILEAAENVHKMAVHILN
ncbi:MAG: dihydrolipoyl dehydrogenase [Planctomycetota bacterium]|nr:MAG: dihydrolipoyl dehydrogenase [Planctomycetota bacterium]